MTHLTTPPNSLLTIDARFNGPARSGHGGVSGGRFAALVDARRAIVDFLAPIPLDEPLSGTRQGEAAHVDGPDGPVAAVTRLAGPLPTGPFGRLAAGEVARAEASWLDARDGDHVAPTCFACGHRRTDDSGLGLRPGPVAGLAL
ncbi:MAG: hypothetical protein KDB21_02440, partial [Acidimicrobiales bacterium]|nr:hypothetical protein [Acidimicrobiales bacterium]